MLKIIDLAPMAAPEPIPSLATIQTYRLVSGMARGQATFLEDDCKQNLDVNTVHSADLALEAPKITQYFLR